MKLKLQTAIFILLGLLYVNFSKAQLGGQISTSLISSTKVVVKVEIYRDCRGVALSKSSLNYGFILWKSAATTTCTSKILNIPYLKFKDITYLEKGAKSPCTLGVSGSKYGIELDYFIDTVDLSSTGILTLMKNTGCSNLSFYVNRCCRNLNLANGAAGTDFYIKSTLYFSGLNRCKNKLNFAPEILFYPHSVSTDLENHAYTPAPVDTIDFDKITCNLSAPLNGLPNTLVKLKSPFSANAPIPTLCIPTGKGFCSPNMSTNPVLGFNFDTITGRMIYYMNASYTTGLNTFTNDVILFNEYREDTAHNWVLIGQSMREFYFNVFNTGGSNNPPQIEASAELSATAGRLFYKEIKVTDEIKIGLQSLADTLQVTTVSGCKAFSMYVKNPKDREKVVVISGTPDSTYCSSVPYRMSILANDQYKTYLSLASAQLLVKVKPLGRYSVSMTLGNCNRVILNVKLASYINDKVKFRWVVKDSATGTIEYIGTKELDSSCALIKGKKIIMLTVTGANFGYDVGTYTLYANYEPIFELIGDTSYCKGSNVNFHVSPLNMQKIKSVQYSVGNNFFLPDTLNKFTNLTVDSAMVLWVTAKDNWGCKATISQNINVLILPKSQFSNGINMCHSEDQFDLLALCSLKRNEYIQIRSNEGYVIYSQYFTASAIPNSLFINKDVVKKMLYYSLVDGNNCVKNDSVWVSVHKLPSIKVDSILRCQNSLSLNLDNQIVYPAASQLSKYKYQWSVVLNPSKILSASLLSNNFDTIKRYFKYGNSKSIDYDGRYGFQLNLIDTATNCLNIDTLYVFVKNEPILSFMQNQEYCARKSNIDLYETVRVDAQTVKNGEVSLTAYNHSNMHAQFYKTQLIRGHFLPKFVAEGRWEFKYISNSLCPDTGINEIRILPSPEAVFSLSTDTLIDMESASIITTNNAIISDNSPLSYLWSPGTGVSSDNRISLNFKFTYPKIEMTYPLMLVAKSYLYGCVDTAVKNIAVKKNVGIHDLQNLGGFFNEKLQVVGMKNKVIETNWYNTSGQLIGTDTENAGIYLPMGLYIYEIKFEKYLSFKPLMGKYFVK